MCNTLSVRYKYTREKCETLSGRFCAICAFLLFKVKRLITCMDTPFHVQSDEQKHRTLFNWVRWRHKYTHTHAQTLSFALLPFNCHSVRAFFYLLHDGLVRLVCWLACFLLMFESLFVLCYFNWNRYQCI